MPLTLAHLSDTHLGYRAYSAIEKGVNQREIDILGSFSRALDAILERDPDIVVHSGDFFHVVRPGNHAIIQAFQRLSRFQAARKGKPFIIVAGNHDTPRSLDLGNILNLFANVDGVRVFSNNAEPVHFDDLDLELLAIPHNSIANKENVAWTPQSTRRNRVLVLHGMEAEAAAGLKTEGDFEFKDTYSERWTYVAMGDVHTHTRFAPNAAYSGATDYTTMNVWMETSAPKGWVYFDAGVGELEFMPIKTRPVYDLKWIDAAGLDAPTLEQRLAANAKWPKGEMPIVRQVVTNVARETANRLGIDWRQEINSRCLHYLPDMRRPIEAFTARGADGTPGITLEMEWMQHIETAAIPPGISAKKVSETGVELLKEVEVDETHSAGA